ncbi:MAG TPA: hypothetical protein VFK13_10115 [Gemmatimonadaceae bacterium]|nr:hypothetical protein [Gemmatimonadaceae bacterium]
MPHAELDVQVRAVEPSEGRAPEVRWPLATLVAFLSDGRESDEVRTLLAAGRGAARGRLLSWRPVHLSPDDLSAVQAELPRPMPDHPFDLDRVTAVQLKIPALNPTLTVPLRTSHPLVREIAARAAYLCFDYGPWADVYVATLTSDEATALLSHPKRRTADAGSAELAARVVGEDDASLHFVVPRPGAPPPWTT